MGNTESKAEEVSCEDLLYLRRNIEDVFGKLNFRPKHGEKELCEQDKTNAASTLGSLMRIYWEFHRRTDEMLPDRASDFSDTSEVIMGRLSEPQRRVCKEAFEKNIVFSVEATNKMNAIPCLPFLGAMTISRLKPSRHQFEAPTFTRHSRRR